MRSSISSPPSPRQGAPRWAEPTAPGSYSCVVRDRFGQIPPSGQTRHLGPSGPDTSSSRLAPRHPGAPYLQALGGRLPHLPAAGFGRGDAGVTLEGAGVRGAAVPLYMWVGVRATCVLEPVGAGGREQEEAARRTAAGNLWARPRRCPGAAARGLRSSARPASARRRRPLPPPPPPPPPPGPARSEHARGPHPLEARSRGRRSPPGPRPSPAGGPLPAAPGRDGVWEERTGGPGERVCQKEKP